jgi:hypothetical protein
MTAFLRAKIDDRPESPNAGKTRFEPGDRVYILVFASNGVTVDAQASAGSIMKVSEGSVPQTETLQFTGTDNDTLTFPAIPPLSTTWLGNNGGSLSLAPGSDRKVIASQGKITGVAEVTYSAAAQIWVLSSPASVEGKTSFPIIVSINGSTS